MASTGGLFDHGLIDISLRDTAAAFGAQNATTATAP